jgi:protein-tyrosine kinase
MSRIHEALRKAELEARTIFTADVHPADQEPASQPKPENGAQLPQIANEIETPVLADLLQTERHWGLEDIKRRCAKVKWQPNPPTDVFAEESPNVEAAEQFRTLRSRLYQLRAEKRLRVVLVTSAIANDGKTFVANNLAKVIVRQPDRHVLLIDADLRSPNLHAVMGAAAAPGLSDYLSGTADEMAVIQHGREGGLYFIAGGKSANNASELLSNGRMKTLIESAAACFDWIIIDSPPCLPVADASVIAGYCDGVLLVVRASATPSSAANRVTQELQKRNLLGVVLNAVDEKTLSYGSYYGRGPYGRSAKDDSTKLIT